MSQTPEYTSVFSVGYTFTGPYRIDLPEEALQEVLDATGGIFSSPLVFSLSNDRDIVKTVGVREFSAPPSQIGVSERLAEDLQLQTGDDLQLSLVQLPKGEQITIKPVNYDPSKPVDWKSLLESWIPKTYTALTLNDRLKIPYLGTEYELEVTDLLPKNEYNAVSVVDTDMDLLIMEDQTLTTGASSTSTAKPEPPKLTVDSTTEFGEALQTLSCDIPSGVERLYVSCSDLAYIGPEHATSPASFIAVAESKPVAVSTALLGSSLSIAAKGSVTISTTNDEPTAETEGKSECEFCGKFIPDQSMMLHTSFCRRNSSKCEQCGQKFGGARSVPVPHIQLHELEKEGSGGQCECAEFSASTAIQLAFHRATTCPLTLHICRFCRLLVPRGPTSPADAAMGLTDHEAQCGNRTADCPLCNKPVRLRSLSSHLSEHDEKRRQRKPPQMCANQNCPYPVSSSDAPAGLCSTCFGPLSVPGANRDAARLKQRIERRYVLQMTRGCAKPWCLNQYCAMNKKRGFSEAMTDTKAIMSNASGKHYFCVDEAQTRKAMFVQLESEYARGWRGLAISQCSSEAEAAQWLQTNANKLTE